MGKVLFVWGSPPLPYQVKEIGVASHGLPESLAYTWDGGRLMRTQFSVPWVQVARSPVSQLTEL